MTSALCVICARSGSKGVPDKNIKTLRGKPLLAHTVEVAVVSEVFEHIIVTSDSSFYLEIATQFGADMVVKRPETLSADSVSKLGAIEHALLFAEKETGITFDTIVDLDVTAPLRLPEDILGALALFNNNEECISVITGSQSHRSPYTNLVEINSRGFVRLSKEGDKSISRRQDSPLCFDMNASIYIWKRNKFLEDPKVFYDNTLLYEMPLERSWDIDHELDFEIVEFLMSRNSSV